MPRRRALVAWITTALFSADCTDSFLLPIALRPSSPHSSTTTHQRLYQAKPAASKAENTIISSSDGSIPANLRRKITAKRPALGHVVPATAPSRRKLSASGGRGAPQLRPQGLAREDNNNNTKKNSSLLRIMGGTCRGRRLESPPVFLRPMMGKVKEAVFSTLTAFGLYDTAYCRHLDVFAGSGSVGLESLSRGATHCTFVDLSPECGRCIDHNLAMTGLGTSEHRVGEADPPRVVCADAMIALTRPQSVGIPEGSTYQIVTLCPPYEEVVYGDLLEAVVGSELVTDDTVILVEYPVELGCLPHVVTVGGHAAVGVRNRRYGRTVIALYVVNPTGALSDAATSRPEEFVQI